jgi:hypothetical protein
MWAGRAADPFYVDLTQVFAMSVAVKNSAELYLSDWRPETAKSSFADTTIHWAGRASVANVDKSI